MNESIEEARVRAKAWVDKEYPQGECEDNIRDIARNAYYSALEDVILRIYKVIKR